MFEREHHQAIEQVLNLLNADLLRQHHCYFGGGTAIALRYGEYRESVDLDFMMSDRAGYRELRALLWDRQSILALFKQEATLVTQLRELRADQYGIRTRIGLGASQIKFEIVLEGRVELETPAASDALCGVSMLTPLDLATSKLLANSDRWADEGVFNRDVIDLAMMNPSGALLTQALSKAGFAYGPTVQTDLGKALTKLIENPGWLETCMRVMKMDRTMPAQLLAALKRLKKHLQKTRK